MALLLLGLLAGGCGRPVTVPVEQVSAVPPALVQWRTEAGISDEPVIAAMQGSEGWYLLVQSGRAPSNQYRLQVTGAEGTGTPTLGIRGTVNDPWLRRGGSQYPETVVHLLWHWQGFPKTFGLQLNDTTYPMELVASDGAVQVYRVRK